MDERLRLIAHNLDKRIGPRKAAAALYRRYGRGRPRLFGRWTGFEDEAAPEWLEPFPPGDELGPGERRAAEEEIARARSHNASIVTWFDEAYPQALRSALCPPPVLYVKGTIGPEDRVAVAIVGSRRPTRDYAEFTYELAYQVAKRGVTVVSGLARGIDRAAHEGALAAGGRTIAVLGSGVDVVYPPEHAGLAQRVAASGALVSFFPMGTPPFPHHFPARNWVIACLCCGVVVVQGSKKSGAMITANFAGALGREVMAVPGHVEHVLSEGPHELLRDGAALVTSADDVVACVDAALLFSGVKRLEPRPTAPATLEEQIVAHLAEGPADAEDLARLLNAQMSAVLAALTRLELAGKVSALSPSRYRLRSDAR